MKENELTLQFISQPGDVNFGGKVHGGTVMKWIDQAAYACASKWSGAYCVTVYVGGIRFYKPVLINSLVKLKSRIIHTGHTSMHISVDVYSKKVTEESFQKTTHCVIVFVAVDENGRPMSTKCFHPMTEKEKRREAYAKKLMELRKGIDAEMNPYFTDNE